jgi:hypothetical protein
MAYPDLYNLNANRSYPLESPSNEVPDRLLLDCGFTMGPRAEFDPETHSVTFISAEWSGDYLVMLFSAASLNFIFTRHKDDPWGAMEYVEAPGGPEYGVGYLVTGALDIVGDIYPSVPLTVEPACTVSQLHHVMTSLNIGNTKRITADNCCEEYPEPVDEETVFNVAEGLTGDIRFKAGYNMGVAVSSVDNAIILSPAIGDGMGAECEEVVRYEGDPGSGGVTCRELIHSITGVAPSESGAFQLVVSNGFGVNINPSANRINVDAELENTVICVEDDDDE